MRPIILSIAGSDSSSGAGIQADLKTIAANGCYGATVITAITSQNTIAIDDIFELPIEVIKSQFNSVVSDLDVQFVKIGMLGSDAIAKEVLKLLKSKDIPYVLDTPLRSKDNTALINDAKATLKKLINDAYIITPNIPEAEILLDMKIKNIEDMKNACKRFDTNCVLLKGGHMDGDSLVDILYCEGKFWEFAHKRVFTKNSHGTGCTLASCIASQLALGENLPKACENAIEYVQQGLKNSYQTGSGNGSLNHFFKLGKKDV